MVHHRTSFYIRNDYLDLLHSIVKGRKRAKDRFIVNLLHNYARKVLQDPVIGQSVQYQNSNVQYKKIYVSLFSYEYEYLLDLRKISKLSVSKILYFALEQWIKQKITSSNMEKYFKNLPLEFYGMLPVKENETYLVWKLFWGFPYDNSS